MSTALRREDLQADLRRVANRVGHPPTIWQYEDYGEFALEDVRHHFESWGAALEAAALDLDARRRWQLGLSGGDE